MKNNKYRVFLFPDELLYALVFLYLIVFLPLVTFFGIAKYGYDIEKFLTDYYLVVPIYFFLYTPFLVFLYLKLFKISVYPGFYVLSKHKSKVIVHKNYITKSKVFKIFPAFYIKTHNNAFYIIFFKKLKYFIDAILIFKIIYLYFGFI